MRCTPRASYCLTPVSPLLSCFSPLPTTRLLSASVSDSFWWYTLVGLDSIYKWYHTVFVFLWLISLSIMPSKSIHVATNGKMSFFVCLGSIPLYVWVLVTQSCLTLCDPVDCRWPPSGQAPLSLKFSRQEYWRSSHSHSPVIFQTQGWTWVSHIAGRFLAVWATREAHYTCTPFFSICSSVDWHLGCLQIWQL